MPQTKKVTFGPNLGPNLPDFLQSHIGFLLVLPLPTKIAIREEEKIHFHRQMGENRSEPT